MIPNFLKKFYKEHDLRPFQSTWLLYVHALAIAGIISLFFYTENLNKIILPFICFWTMYAIGITGGSHRLWAHKSYQASTPMKILLMFWNSGANQGSIYHWSRDHRLHHKFSDTDLDPHDMTKGFFFSHCGWLLKKKSKKLVEEGRKIDMSDLEKDKIVMFQKKHYLPLSLLMCFAVPTFTYYFYSGLPLHASFFMSMVNYAFLLNATWMVNSVCHMFGSRPYNKNIEPRENYLVTILTHGEGYHNWHHEYPSDWRASKDEWYQINTTSRFIQICAKLKLANIKA